MIRPAAQPAARMGMFGPPSAPRLQRKGRDLDIEKVLCVAAEAPHCERCFHFVADLVNLIRLMRDLLELEERHCAEHRAERKR